MWARHAAFAAVAGALACVLQVQAQLVEDPDWKELDAPPPPSFSTSRLAPIEMPVGMSLRYGVDPDTVRLTSDGIIRYVMVATGQGGAINAQYESIRCATAEYKVLARTTSADGTWNAARDPQWVPLDRTPRTLHAFLLSRQSLCKSRATAGHSSKELAYRLMHPPQESLN